MISTRTQKKTTKKLRSNMCRHSAASAFVCKKNTQTRKLCHLYAVMISTVFISFCTAKYELVDSLQNQWLKVHKDYNMNFYFIRRIILNISCPQLYEPGNITQLYSNITHSCVEYTLLCLDISNVAEEVIKINLNKFCI